MIRGLLLFIAIYILYFAVKTVVRSAVRSYREDERKRGNGRIMGDEMVLDPVCRTYVVKNRAVTRRIKGTLMHFCSDVCAGRYEDKNRA